MSDIWVEDDSLRISFTPGGSDLAVVSFTGVASGLGGIRSEEFRRSLALSQAELASVLYVTDQRCSWYGDGLDARIAEAVDALLHRLGARRVVTLGNSMGGFGAIVFARRLHGCRRAIAFAPQSSVDRKIAPFEDRYLDRVGRVGGWTAPDAVAELDPRISYHLYFGRQDPIDLLHAQRFQAGATAGAEVTILPDAGHGVAAALRDAGGLYPLLRRLVLDDATVGDGARP